MNNSKRRFIVGLAALMCASSQAQPEVGIPVSSQGAAVIVVQPAQTGASVTLGGSVVPYKQVALTAQIPGRIEFIAGTEGDRFKAQDILVTIDDDDLLAQRRAALAQLSNAQAEIGNAQMQYSRELISPQGKSLYRSGGMGMPGMFDQMFTQPLSGAMPGNVGGDRYVDRQADLYSYGSRLSQAQSGELTARSQIDQIDARLRDARSFAPFEGVIIKKMVEVGDTVQPGMQLLEFADTTYLQVQVDVPSRLVPSLSKGMLVPARLDVGNTRVEARVAQIFPAADAVRHTVTVKFDLPEGVPGGPGMYAEVMLPDNTAPSTVVPVIPDSAVLWRGALPAIYVLDEKNQPQLRLIRLGDYVNNDQVSVLSGVTVGERIFAQPPTTASGWSTNNPNQNP